MSLFIPVLLGTTRDGRLSERAAAAVLAHGQTMPGLETQLVDPRELNLPDDGKTFRDPVYSDILARADGLFIVTPEYNHSFPPSIKRMLDSEGRELYAMKPVAIAGVSDGRWGGTRVIEALLPVLRTLDMYISARDVHFAVAPELFDSKGGLADEQVETEIAKAWDALVQKARVLQAGRS
ncbi:MAG: NADPH-dependent FMN reductase [candidate division WS6 bacterium OLB20]|uniref:NADPH-dependent FMN reductase n=1 Tax=candidate division WS6 bacterium OLB20 TaxID=1617426 RepID=A0A136LYT4_9BACT|nr:MAG: NADPH-dependent FMN reductase [candidate division WS6 bacterium OLB20]